MSESVKVGFTATEAADLCEILTHELAGHHNRLESATLRGDRDFAQECAVAANKVRNLRTIINRAVFGRESEAN